MKLIIEPLEFNSDISIINKKSGIFKFSFNGTSRILKNQTSELFYKDDEIQLNLRIIDKNITEVLKILCGFKEGKLKEINKND